MFKTLDERKTKANARDVLKQYMRMKRVTGLTDTLKAIEYSDMPAAPRSQNGAEQQILKQLANVGKDEMDYTKKIREMERAIEQTSDVSRQILVHSYCRRDKLTIRAIARLVEVYEEAADGTLERIYYTEDNIKKLKGRALIEFAEAYQAGKLLAYQ